LGYYIQTHWVITGTNGSGKISSRSVTCRCRRYWRAVRFSGLAKKGRFWCSFEAQSRTDLPKRLKKDDADIMDVISLARPFMEMIFDRCPKPELAKNGGWKSSA